jgi:hypothetical protein
MVRVIEGAVVTFIKRGLVRDVVLSRISNDITCRKAQRQ